MNKMILITTFILSLTAAAEDGYFGPGRLGCPDGACKSMQMPGSANLANNRGVLNTANPIKKNRRNGSPPAGTAPVSK